MTVPAWTATVAYARPAPQPAAAKAPAKHAKPVQPRFSRCTPITVTGSRIGTAYTTGKIQAAPRPRIKPSPIPSSST